MAIPQKLRNLHKEVDQTFMSNKPRGPVESQWNHGTNTYCNKEQEDIGSGFSEANPVSLIYCHCYSYYFVE